MCVYWANCNALIMVILSCCSQRLRTTISILSYKAILSLGWWKQQTYMCIHVRYCASRLLLDEDGRVTQFSYWFGEEYSFQLARKSLLYIMHSQFFFHMMYERISTSLLLHIQYFWTAKRLNDNNNMAIYIALNTQKEFHSVYR